MMAQETLREAVARIIAAELGDDFEEAFVDKAAWINARGQSGGRFRDVNEPLQSDYLDAADAAIATMFERLRTPREEVIVDLAASLAAAISLLERGGKAAKKAAPSDKMFDLMVKDYKASLNRARKALTAFQQENSDATTDR